MNMCIHFFGTPSPTPYFATIESLFSLFLYKEKIEDDGIYLLSTNSVTMVNLE